MASLRAKRKEPRRLKRSPARLLRWAPAALALFFSPLWAADVAIEFLPPPMPGVISLGIYDAGGKLVRVLKAEAAVTEFMIGLNGLITRWDGKDDAGAPCPPGAYRARGYLVGDLGIEGVDFHGNDWVDEEDSPRIRRIRRLAALPEGKLLLEALPPGSETPALYEAAPGKEGEWSLAAAAPETVFPAPSVTVEAGQVKLPGGALLPGVSGAADAALGQDGAVWVIEGREIRSYSPEGKPLKPLPTPGPEALPPVKIAAASDRPAVYLLSEIADAQELRGVEPQEGKPLFAKAILASDRLEQAAPWLKFADGKPFLPVPQLRVPLKKNPLLHKGKPAVEVRVEARPTGTVLLTADGLPLAQISETPHLLWAAIGRPEKGKAITIFESDGAVVAEFKVARPAEMMAFDAGALEIPKPAETPSPSPVPEESPSATPLPAETPVETPTPGESPTPAGTETATPPAPTAVPSESPSATPA